MPEVQAGLAQLGAEGWEVIEPSEGGEFGRAQYAAIDSQNRLIGAGGGVVLDVGAAQALADAQFVVTDPLFGGEYGGDWTTAFFLAATAAKNNGGGIVVIPPMNTDYAVLSLPIFNNVIYKGSGSGNTKVKLKNGANSDVFVSTDAYDLFATNHTSALGVFGWGIEGLTIDGNSQNQNPSNPDTCNGICFYGTKYSIRDVNIVNVKGHGIRSDWYQYGETLGGIEPTIENVTIDGTGRHGWWAAGPHDHNIEHMIVIDASKEADSTYCGVYTDGTFTARFWNLHVWHRGSATNRVKYSVSSKGGSEFIACHLEGGRQIFEHRGQGDLLSTCNLYACTGPNGVALVDFKNNLNNHIGCKYSGYPTTVVGAGAQYYAFKFGVAGGDSASANSIMDAETNSFFLTPFNFANDGGHNKVRAYGYQAVGASTSFSGTKAYTTSVSYRQSGTIIASDIYQTNQAIVADGTVVNGNTRGANAVDHQLERFQNNQVASGWRAVVGGGLANTASGSQSTVAGGNQNVASGEGASVLGGTLNVASGSHSVAGGRGAVTQGVYGRDSFASGFFAAQGDAQASILLLRAETTNATAARLTSDGLAQTAFNQLLLQNNSVVSCAILVSARDTANGESASWKIDALIKRLANAASTAIVGTPTVTKTFADAGASSWVAAVAADTAGGVLGVNCTGQSGKTIRWLARVESVEVS